MEDITIPSGYDAKIEGDKVVFVKKESEDEKIRKEILSFLKDGSPYYCPGSITRQKWVAYFEKQKPVEKPKWYDSMDDLIADALIEMVEESDLIDRDKKNRLVWIEKHRTKPAEWSEEDRHSIENCEYAIKETFKDEQNPHRIGTLDWLKSLRPQPKQEWNEEDKSKLSALLGMLTVMRNLNSNDIIVGIYSKKDREKRFNEIETWLKSLPERFNLQPKQEWSKEDEDYFQNLIMAVDSTFNEGYTKDWLQNRLKPLVERFNPQPGLSKEDFIKFGNLEYERGRQDGIQSAERTRWKPSEKQMKALRIALRCGIQLGTWEEDALKSLHEELKKRI